MTRVFSLDLRSLAVFRIGLGVLLVVDVAIRLQDFTDHYTDAGFLPVSALDRIPDPAWWTSLHHWSGSPAWQGFLLALAGLAGLALALGWRTRVACWTSWVLMLSIQARNPMVLDGADMLFRHLLFWGGFLPLGARWSWDAEGRPPQPGPSVSGGPAFALAMQPVLLYEFAAMTKSGPEWMQEGTGVYYALALDQLSQAPGRFLLAFPGLMRVLNHATVVLEYLGPLLLFSPWRTVPIRIATILAFVALQAGFGLCIRLMLFPWLSTLSLVPLIPGEVWDRWGYRDPGQTAPDPAALPASAPGPRRPVDVLALAILGYVVLWNASVLPEPLVRIPPGLRAPGYLLRLEQQWFLFAPPWKTDGWYLAEGATLDGRWFDLTTGEPARRDSPGDTWARFPTHRQWATMRYLGYRGSEPLRELYLTTLLRRWKGPRLVRARLVYMLEETRPDGTQGPPEPRILHEMFTGLGAGILPPGDSRSPG